MAAGFFFRFLLELQPLLFTLVFFPALLASNMEDARLPYNGFSSKKKTFSFHLYFCFLLFTQFFLFRAPLTEMTRLLLIVLRCTQFNLSFRFTF